MKDLGLVYEEETERSFEIWFSIFFSNLEILYLLFRVRVRARISVSVRKRVRVSHC